MDNIIDRLIIGTWNGASYTKSIEDLIKRITSGQDIVATEATFLNTDSVFLAVLMFNYPLIKESDFREFAAAVKKISGAKYTYLKKSSSFKEHFNKLLTEVFNKFHQSELRDQKDQIQKVKYAIPLVKYIGELYNVDHFENSKIKTFLENLVEASESSKVSEDCLRVLISIISNRAKNEFKQIHKHNHDVHTAAIMKILAEYEEGFDEVNAKKKKIYKDLEIIEVVNKTINKNGKISKQSKKMPVLNAKSEIIKQSKKILETIIAGSIPLPSCVQTAHEYSLLYPDTFENEMFQLCLEYIKRHLVNVDEVNLSTTCVTLGKFIGKLYCADVFRSESIKGTLSLLSKYEGIEYTKTIQDVILNSIYAKVMEEADDVLQSFIPEDFRATSSDGEIENDETNNEINGVREKIDVAPIIKKEEKKSSSVTVVSINQPSVSVAIPLYQTPMDRFTELLNKLSSTNIAYILREISQIPFVTGDETFNDLARILVSHALKKQTLIKAVVQVCLKLPETIVPHFQMSLLKKHLKLNISNSVVGCTEDKATGCSLLVKELHLAGIYDRFDIILLLENFTINFDNDRTALSSLIKFTDELKDIINNNKKLSKNMTTKLKRIGERLTEQSRNENYKDYKASIEAAVKILNGEYRAQLINNNCNNVNGTNGNLMHQDSKSENDDQDEEGAEEERTPQQMILGNLILRYPSRKTSTPTQYPATNSSPPTPPPAPIQRPTYMPSQVSIENAFINNEPFFRSSTPDRSTPAISETCSSNDDTNYSLQPPPEELYSTVVNCGPPNASIASSDQHDDDEQFYDTVSNSDSNESETSNFKFLEECTRNRIQELRELIFEQVSSKELSEFVATIILLGTKFQSINTFLKFLGVVEEALDRQGKDAHVNFKKYLEMKIPTFYDLLVCSQDLPKNERERNEVEHLIIITGEFYNKSLISDDFYFKVLEKLWNEIINGHHIKLFNLLIVTCAAKITRNGHAPKCKEYLDNLAKYIHSFEEVKDRQVLSNELIKTLKLLMIHNQEVKKQTIVTPQNFIKASLVTINEENFKNIVQQIKRVFPVKKSEMIEIVDIYIKAATLSNNQELFVKFAEKIRNAATVDALNFTFKAYLEERLKAQMPKLLDDIERMETITNKWTSMVGDLYLANVVTIELMSVTFQALFEREAKNTKYVDNINILMRKVAPKMDSENILILDTFFKYFMMIIMREDSYRTKVYRELLRLRSMKWNDKENDVNIMEDFLQQVTMKNLVEITNNIAKKITDEKSLNEFINSLWKFVIRNPEPDEIMKYAKLTQGLSYSIGKFNSALMNFMRQRNTTFCLIPLQEFSQSISKKLSTAIHFMCYLYTIDVAGEKDLEMWMRPNLVQHLTLMQNVDFSIKLGPKISESSNVNLKAFLTFVELSIKEQHLGLYTDVKKNLQEALN